MALYKECKTLKFPGNESIYVITDDRKVPIDQGIENSGKILSVGKDGFVTLINAPSGNGTGELEYTPASKEEFQWLANNAVLTSEQEFTDEQKQIARQNIDSPRKPIIIAIQQNGDEYTVLNMTSFEYITGADIISTLITEDGSFLMVAECDIDEKGFVGEILFCGTTDTSVQFVAIDSINNRFIVFEVPIDNYIVTVTTIPISGNIGSSSDNIPDYVRLEAERVAKVVQSRQNANTITFIACSDIHYSSPNNANPISTAQSIHEATLHMGQAMGIIRSLVHIDFAAMLGDMIRDNGESSVDEVQAEVRFVNSCLNEGFSGIPIFRIEGNHDEAYDSNVCLNQSQVFANIHAWNVGSVYGDRSIGYCYRDFEDVKLRVICLNATEGSGSDINISAKQADWLASVLNLSDKDNNWCSVILSHQPLDFGRAGGVDVIPIINNASGLIGTFHGHIHNFLVDYITGTEIKRIAIPNSVRDQENSYASTLPIFAEDVKYKKTAGTAQDTSFCVVTIDLAERKIYADHYGAGYSREIDYTYKGAGPRYTNLVPSSIDPSTSAVYGVDYNGDGTADGYKNDVYGSGVGEGSTTDTNCVLTGLIAYGHGKTDPIYIKGANITTASHCRILGFNSEKQAQFQAAEGSAITTYFTVENLGDSYWMVTPISGSVGDTTYLRFSLINPDGGANLIITIGEPIE